MWCSNPESISPDLQLGYNVEKCLQCHTCVTICSRNVFSIASERLVVDFNACNACGICIDECPSGALKIYGNERDSSEIIEEVLLDFDYYKNSGGGITLLGGDPLFQYDFALDILKKSEGKWLKHVSRK